MRCSVPGERPQGVRLLAILLVMGAAGSVAELADDLPASGDRDAADRILTFIVLFLHFGLPVGLWYYQRWAHALLVLLFMLVALGSLISMVILPGRVEFWVQGTINAWILWYLLVPRVRAAFWGRRSKGAPELE